MKSFIQILLVLCLTSCNRTLNVNVVDERLLGTYKRGSDNFREILHLEDSYILTSEFSSIIFGDEVFKEKGNWRVIHDTLLIERTRHEKLERADFPKNQRYLIKEGRLFELRRNYKGQLFEDQSYLEKQ